MAKKWYMITTISGKEEKVIESLNNRIVAENLAPIIEKCQVMLVPHLSKREYEKKLRGDNFKVKYKNLFPGYIFLFMEMTNDAWFIVRNTQYVTGLVGSSGQRTKPTPISRIEMRKMEETIRKTKENFEKGVYHSPFEEGQFVEITDGPTKGLTGSILDTDDLREVAIVELVLFERKTPTEIAYKNLQIKS